MKSLRPMLVLLISACALMLPNAALASGKYCPEKPVPFSVTGAGKLYIHEYQYPMTEPLAVSEFTGSRLSFSTQGLAFYEARNVTVTFRIKGVNYTAMPGAMFKPGCVFPTSLRRDIPAPGLQRGRIVVKGSRHNPPHGVLTNNGTFYSHSPGVTRFVVTRKLRSSVEINKGIDTMKVSRGADITVTPFDSITRSPCRSGRTLRMDWRGHVTGG